MTARETKIATQSLVAALVINTALTVFELAAGVLVGSLALIADGSRNLTDSLVIAVAYAAEHISRREPDSQRTWGYGRVKIIASLINTGIILAVAISIGYEAISRFAHPASVPGGPIIMVAAASVVINAIAAAFLYRHKKDINVRAAYTSLKFGAISSVGIVVAGLVIVAFGASWVDGASGLAVALILLYATVRLARDATHILLEGVPAGINMIHVEESLLEIKGVERIGEVHAWTIEPKNYAFSCHMIVRDDYLSEGHLLAAEAKGILKHKFHFSHSTIEIQQ